MSTRRRTLAASLLALSLGASRRAIAQSASPEVQPPAGAGLLFAVEFRVGANWDAARKPHEQAFFREHSANLKRLRESGQLLLGARYSDKGLVVLAAESEAGARALVDADPAVQNQVFAYELHAFKVFYPGCIPAARRAG